MQSIVKQIKDNSDFNNLDSQKLREITKDDLSNSGLAKQIVNNINIQDVLVYEDEDIKQYFFQLNNNDLLVYEIYNIGKEKAENASFYHNENGILFKANALDIDLFNVTKSYKIIVSEAIKKFSKFQNIWSKYYNRDGKTINNQKFDDEDKNEINKDDFRLIEYEYLNIALKYGNSEDLEKTKEFFNKVFIEKIKKQLGNILTFSDNAEYPFNKYSAIIKDINDNIFLVENETLSSGTIFYETLDDNKSENLGKIKNVVFIDNEVNGFKSLSGYLDYLNSINDRKLTNMAYYYRMKKTFSVECE